MGYSWMTQSWLAFTNISFLAQLFGFTLAPWLKCSKVFSVTSRFCLWVLLECFLVWFLLRCVWYHTVPLASLYESFCVLALLICALNLLVLGPTLRIKRTSPWLALGITILLGGVLLFVDSALPVAMQQSDGPPQSLRAPWLSVHVSMMIVSYAFLTSGSLAVLGGIYAIRYVLKIRLKSSESSKVFNSLN